MNTRFQFLHGKEGWFSFLFLPPWPFLSATSWRLQIIGGLLNLGSPVGRDENERKKKKVSDRDRQRRAQTPPPTCTSGVRACLLSVCQCRYSIIPLSLPSSTISFRLQRVHYFSFLHRNLLGECNRTTSCALYNAGLFHLFPLPFFPSLAFLHPSLCLHFLISPSLTIVQA